MQPFTRPNTLLAAEFWPYQYGCSRVPVRERAGSCHRGLNVLGLAAMLVRSSGPPPHTRWAEWWDEFAVVTQDLEVLVVGVFSCGFHFTGLFSCGEKGSGLTLLFTSIPWTSAWWNNPTFNFFHPSLSHLVCTSLVRNASSFDFSHKWAQCDLGLCSIICRLDVCLCLLVEKSLSLVPVTHMHLKEAASVKLPQHFPRSPLTSLCLSLSFFLPPFPP